MAYNNTISILISAKDEASSVLRATAKSVEDSGSQIAAFGAKATAVGSTLSKTVTLPIVGVAAAAVKMAGDFQASMTRLVTSAGESQDNLQQVSAGVLQIARDTGTSTTQLAQAMYMVESGGQHGAAGLEVLKAAAQGAKTENADLATVADAVTSAMTDYHLPASQAADVTSKLVAATGQGKTTFQDLAGAMSALLPKASAAGISLNEILGDLASMTLHGISAQQAAENMADAISHLQVPTQGMSKELAALGLNSTQLSQNLGTVGLTGTIQKIAHAIQSDMGPQSTAVILNMQQALQGLPTAVQNVSQEVINGTATWTDWNKATKDLPVTQRAQAQAFATLYNGMHTIGTEQMTGAQVMQTYGGAMNKAMGDSAGLNVALMLTGQNTDNTTKSIQAVSGATADASGNVKGWADIQQTFNFHMAQFKATLQTSAITLGNDLLPALTTMVTKITDAAKWFEALNPGQRKFIEQTAGIVAILGPATLITGRFASAISSISGVLKGASSAMGLFSTKHVVSEAGTAISSLGRGAGLAGAAEGAGAALGEGGGLLAAMGPVGLGLGVVALAAGGAYLWMNHLKNATNDTAKAYTGAYSPVSMLALEQDNYTKKTTDATKATLAMGVVNQQTMPIREQVKQKTQDLADAQAAANKALNTFGTNSPQYQSAVAALTQKQNDYDAALAAEATNNINVLAQEDNLYNAKRALTQANADAVGMQNTLTAALNGTLGVIHNFGPAAEDQLKPIATLQVAVSGIVTSWGGFYNDFQSQNAVVNGLVLQTTRTLDTIQVQSSQINNTLTASGANAGSLQGAAGIPGGATGIKLHALGTDYSTGGTALVGEQGPELVNLPRGAQVAPASKTKQMLSGAGQVVNNLSGHFVFNTQESVDAFFNRLDKTQRLAKMGLA